MDFVVESSRSSARQSKPHSFSPFSPSSSSGPRHDQHSANPNVNTWASQAPSPVSLLQSSGFSTSLPPLSGPSSPRRENQRTLDDNRDKEGGSKASGQSVRDSRDYRHYPQFAGRDRHYIENDYPVAQVDSWPLTSRSTYKRPFASPPQRSSSSSPEKKEHCSSPDAPTSSSTQILRINHELTSTTLAFASPISPRQRKALQRHTLLDESKSKPLLLQELQTFVDSELAELAQQQQREQQSEGDDDSENSQRQQSAAASTTECSLQRLQVFRQVFQRVISSFSVYAPVLSQIQNEYERVITKMRAQCLQIPKLHSQLQTLQTKCVHEISAHSLEMKLRSQALKKQLKSTQGRLTALAAQNAVLQEQNTKLQAQIEKLDKRSSEMALSNHSLVNGMKRHDDTLRHIHERSREEGMALAQMTSKYHHACEEIAELKKTIATLEEKVGGVHVAADKATIALLTKDLQEMHSKLQESLTSSTAAAVAELSQSLVQQTALAHAFVKVLEAQGVTVNFHELLALLKKSSSTSWDASESALVLSPRTGLSSSRSSSSASGSSVLGGLSASKSVLITASTISGSEYAEATKAVATWVLEKLLAQRRSGGDSNSSNTGESSMSTSSTFLTEPDEILSLERAAQALSVSSDFFPGRGFGVDVPEYLQCDGLVRNLHFPKKKLQQILTRVWQQKDDLEKIKRSHFASIGGFSSSSSSISSGSGATVSTTASGNQQGGVVPLAKVFSMMLNRICASKSEAIESAYNILAALERFAPHSSDCRLFLLILQGEIPEEARQDQAKELYNVHDALAALEKERNTSGGGPQAAIVAPGRVPLADVVQLLRHLFPWKTERALSSLYRALLIDQRGRAQVDYAALLLQHQQDDKRHLRATATAPGASKTSHFVECLRAQYIDDLLAYRRHLQSSIQQKLLASPGSGGGDSATVTGTLVGEANAATGPDGAIPSGPGSSSGSSPAATVPSEPISNTSSSAMMISIRALRDFLQECDAAKPVQEINRLLATAAGLSLDQILTQDAMVVSAQQFLCKLPTLLAKPTGKFQSSGSSSSSVYIRAAAATTPVAMAASGS